MTNMHPKVSVMVVSYNQEELIGETLDSILADTYPNIEIVVSDDASQDNTAQILREYQKRFPDKLKIILNEKNVGITKNCNIALSACTGDFVALFAGDDLFLPGKLSAQVQAFVRNPELVLCYHPVEIFNSIDNKTLFITHQNSKAIIDSAEDIICSTGVSACSVMIRRSAAPEGGFDVRLKTVSDWLFQIEVALKGKIAKIDGIYARYRKHPHGTTQKVAELLEETLYTLDLLLEKYPNNGFLIDNCRKGKARYLAGEAMRQLNTNPSYAYSLIQKALEFHPESKQYKLFASFCKIITKSKILSFLMVPFVIKSQALIKRYWI